jgi:hypothetical protein
MIEFCSIIMPVLQIRPRPYRPEIPFDSSSAAIKSGGSSHPVRRQLDLFAVEAALEDLLGRGELRDFAQVKSAAAPERVEVPYCRIESPDLSVYDEVLSVGGEA